MRLHMEVQVNFCLTEINTGDSPSGKQGLQGHSPCWNVWMMLLHQVLIVGRVREVSEGHLEFAYVQVSLKQNILRKESRIKEWKGWKDVLVSLRVKVKYHSRVFLAKNRLLFKLYAIWQMCVLGWPCWVILQMHPQLWNPLQHTFKCIVGLLVPPAILSAFAGAMSSREDLGRCPLLQGQTGVARCLSSLAGQTVCRRQADTSPSGNFEFRAFLGQL